MIHHSANTRKILEEMRRVLRPGAEALVMVYHRTFWEYYVQGAMLAALSGQIFKPAVHCTQVSSAERTARSPGITSAQEWEQLVSDLFTVKDVRVYGKKTELVPIPAGKLKDLLVGAIPNSFSRLLTNKCRWGSFLVTRLVKEAV